MSISSSDGLSGNRLKSSCLKMMWQVEQDRVPSQAPKWIKGEYYDTLLHF